VKDTWLNRIIDWLGWGPCVGFFSFHSVRLQWNEQSECKREANGNEKEKEEEWKGKEWFCALLFLFVFFVHLN